MTAQYCLPSDVRDLLRGMDASGTGTAAELPDTQMTAAIIRASTVVTAYVGTDYEADQYNANPVIPQMVKYLTVGLSSYYATLIYRKGKALEPTDPIYLIYLDVRAIFADIVSGKIEVSPGKPNEAPEHQGNVRQTIPGIFTPSDSGVKLDNGRVSPSGAMAWGGYAPSPWAGYDQGN